MIVSVCESEGWSIVNRKWSNGELINRSERRRINLRVATVRFHGGANEMERSIKSEQRSNVSEVRNQESKFLV